MAHNGTYTNGPTLGVTGLVTGDSDTAVSFSPASNQYVVQNDTIAAQTFNAFTIGVIAKPADPSDANAPALFGVLGNTDDVQLLITSGAKGWLTAEANNGGSPTQADVFGSSTLVAGTTYLFIGTWNGTTLRLDINGASEGSTPFGDPVDFVSPEAFYAATDPTRTTGNQSFNGVLAHAFFVPNHAATAGEKTAIVNAFNGTGDIGSAILALSPYLYWKLNETSGTTAFDSAGSSGNFRFNPPTENVVSNVAFDVPPLWNRLRRYYPIGPRGKTVWHLEDDTITFDQPYPTVEDTTANRDSLFPAVPTPPSGYGTSTSNLTAVTYKRVYLGGHTYVVNQAEETLLAAFLTAQGYTPSDWLVPI